MSSGLAVSLLGWIVAMAAGAVAAASWREMARRSEQVVRALHEVRRPLTAARLGLHGLGAGDRTRERRAMAVDRELRRLAFTLEDLDAARVGREAREEAETIELGELLTDAAVAWAPVARAFGAEVAVDAPDAVAMLRGDRMRLTQACGNLLANAIEHAGGHIELRGRTFGERVRIEVVDEGPGLPAPVAQLTRAARAGRGSRGRGLAIASEIAARHGGRLAAAPSPRGARITLELPTAGPRARLR